MDIDVTEITGVTWAITAQPPGGTDALEASPLGETVPIYEPKDRRNIKLAGRMHAAPHRRRPVHRDGHGRGRMASPSS